MTKNICFKIVGILIRLLDYKKGDFVTVFTVGRKPVSRRTRRNENREKSTIG